MTTMAPPPAAGSEAFGIGRWPLVSRWLAVVLASLAIGAGLEAAGIPAALLLGPMLGAILASLAGAVLSVPRRPYDGAQALIGCLIASSFKPGLVATVGANAGLFVAVVVATYVASLGLGYLTARLKILPGSTAVWGSSPGAAGAMMLMAEAFGADARLVAFMQYLRVVFVALAASLVARLFAVHGAGGAAPAWFPPLDGLRSAETIALVVVGALVGRASKIPAGPLLVPMVLGGMLRATGLASFDLPPWLLAAGYAIVGWKIGLGFTRDVVARAALAFLPVAANILILIAVCAGLAWLLVIWVGVDPLTAYLATSPGGMDSIAIIAASSKTDLPFVMALHAMRFLIVLTLGPTIARFVARRTT